MTDEKPNKRKRDQQPTSGRDSHLAPGRQAETNPRSFSDVPDRPEGAGARFVVVLCHRCRTTILLGLMGRVHYCCCSSREHKIYVDGRHEVPVIHAGWDSAYSLEQKVKYD